MKPLSWRPLAIQDADTAAGWYAEQGGAALELQFIEALEKVSQHIAAHPTSGSLRYAERLKLNSLRFWPLKQFPYLVFYLEHEAYIDIWRVLHSESDIPAWIHDDAFL